MTKLAFAILLCSVPALADEPPPPHHPRHPPKEAVDACANKARGDACAFKLRDHDVTGTCFAPPDKPRLACKPDHPPPPPPTPPQD